MPRLPKPNMGYSSASAFAQIRLNLGHGHCCKNGTNGQTLTANILMSIGSIPINPFLKIIRLMRYLANDLCKIYKPVIHSITFTKDNVIFVNHYFFEIYHQSSFLLFITVSLMDCIVSFITVIIA